MRTRAWAHPPPPPPMIGFLHLQLILHYVTLISLSYSIQCCRWWNVRFACTWRWFYSAHYSRCFFFTCFPSQYVASDCAGDLLHTDLPGTFSLCVDCCCYFNNHHNAVLILHSFIVCAAFGTHTTAITSISRHSRPFTFPRFVSSSFSL